MKPSRLFLLIVTGCSLLCSSRLLMAQAGGASFDVSQQYSADMVVIPKGGKPVTQKAYSDNGKIRLEMNTEGTDMVSIIRSDLKKIYTVVPSQKIVLEMSYDPETHPVPGLATGDDGKFEVVGTETVEGIACTKYKRTGKDDKVVFFWIDAPRKALVKMVPQDGSATIIWKNFVAGPQDATLFEPPSTYKKVPMPTAPEMQGAQPSEPPDQ